MKFGYAFPVAIVCVLLCANQTVAYRGKWPGKGSEHVWRQAADLNNEALAESKAHRSDLAVSLLKKAIAMYPDDPDFYSNLGLIYEDDKRDFVNARNCFDKCIEMAPTDLDYRLGYAGFFKDQNDFDSAETAMSLARRYVKTQSELEQWNKDKADLDAKRRLYLSSHGK